MQHADFGTKRMMTEPEGMNYVGMGRTKFREWARQIGAVKKIGRAVRYDAKVIDAALDEASAVR